MVGWLVGRCSVVGGRLVGGFKETPMKNDENFEEDLSCHFKIDTRNLTNFDLSTQKSKKICSLMGSF